MSKFKIGDFVTFVGKTTVGHGLAVDHGLTVGKVYQVVALEPAYAYANIDILHVKGERAGLYDFRFELYDDDPED